MQRDPNCYQTMSDAGLRGREGVVFGATEAFMRIELLMRPDTFDKMAAKLSQLAMS